MFLKKLMIFAPKQQNLPLLTQSLLVVYDRLKRSLFLIAIAGFFSREMSVWIRRLHQSKTSVPTWLKWTCSTVVLKTMASFAAGLQWDLRTTSRMLWHSKESRVRWGCDWKRPPQKQGQWHFRSFHWKKCCIPAMGMSSFSFLLLEPSFNQRACGLESDSAGKLPESRPTRVHCHCLLVSV